MKVLFVPISVVGCGKTTIFRALCKLSNEFSHIENDDCVSKNDFYKKVEGALRSSSVRAVFLDRNNHLRMHRKEIMQKFKSEQVLTVALLFVSPRKKLQSMYDMILARINERGDNHQQIKSESEAGKARMILNSFMKNFANYDANDEFDSQFDYILEMSTGANSSLENVHKIVHLYDQLAHDVLLSEPLSPSNEAIEKAVLEARSYQISN